MNRLRLALVVASVVALTGCKSIDKLVAGGQYDAAIERAVAKRRPPKGKHARAWAVALLETNRFDEARGVLLADYQRGGNLTSLRALADLELQRGLQGTAAVHYSRIAELDVSRLVGLEDVCALLRRRADAFAQAGSGQAAAQDLSRAEDACGRPTDARAQRRLLEIEARVHAAARTEVDARVQTSLCRTTGEDLDPLNAEPGSGEPAPDGLCDADLTLEHSALAKAVTRAAAEGAAALREVARTHRLSVTPEQVVMLLEADISGALGPAIIGDEEVRRWVGDAEWSEFAPLVAAQAKGPAAYVQLRLQAVLDDLPLPPSVRRRTPQRAVWVAQATDWAGRDAWRIFAWLGELGATELALATAWRPRSTPTAPTPAASGAAVPGDLARSPAASSERPQPTSHSPPPRHWSARLAPSTD
ncbi:MAG: hypothetical protein JKY37_25520, partial [Nannocystaceae bacterium]|nr:hypothetical protein [Nannocystaceae bacterium]